MDKDYAAKYRRLEDRNWWFVARRDMVGRLLKGTDTGARILDVGCSGGTMIRFLLDKGFRDITGIDVSEEAVEGCRRKGLTQVHCMDGENPDFPDGTFDEVIASDVLEHLPRDRNALESWRRLLKPGGRLILFVPAFRFLWSKHDEVNHHFRRYHRKELLGLLKEAGFTVRRCSYWNVLLFPPIAAVRLLQRLMRKDSAEMDQLHDISPAINAALIGLFKIENILLERLSMPFGVSIFVLAEKPAPPPG
ncbi:MAG: methyltransferase domain-containing protein [Candidatus Omnitrophota bacterium]|nr:methyltransferase domain-containing protein [Candidatus Omnitrophota bacterium]MDZ4241948.1 methyltransferase domain-containing protein [Candidatus Omnitrophota bacterium]